MDASQVCDSLIRKLKATKLNFFLRESPFSLAINVKKKFIKNQAWIELNPEVDEDQQQTSFLRR